MKKTGLLRRLFQGAEKQPEPCLKTESHQVAGVDHYAKAVMAMAKPNPDYRKTQAAMQREGCIYSTIYAYKWPLCKADLVPEPENPHDPKAIKVLADGRLIGYIKKGSCAHIHKLIREDRIERMTCEIGGGPGKMLVPDMDSDRERYLLQQGDTILWAKVTIHLKPEK